MTKDQIKVHDNCLQCQQKVNSFLITAEKKNPQLFNNLSFLKIKTDPNRSIKQDDGVKPLFVFSHHNHVYGFFNQAVLVSLATTQFSNIKKGMIILSRESLTARINAEKPNNEQKENKYLPTKTPGAVSATPVITNIMKQNSELRQNLDKVRINAHDTNIMLYQRQQQMATANVKQHRITKRILAIILVLILLLGVGLGVGTWQMILHFPISNNDTHNSDPGIVDLSHHSHDYTQEEVMIPDITNKSALTALLQLPDLDPILKSLLDNSDIKIWFQETDYDPTIASEKTIIIDGSAVPGYINEASVKVKIGSWAQSVDVPFTASSSLNVEGKTYFKSSNKNIYLVENSNYENPIEITGFNGNVSKMVDNNGTLYAYTDKELYTFTTADDVKLVKTFSNKILGMAVDTNSNITYVLLDNYELFGSNDDFTTKQISISKANGLQTMETDDEGYVYITTNSVYSSRDWTVKPFMNVAYSGWVFKMLISTNKNLYYFAQKTTSTTGYIVNSDLNSHQCDIVHTSYLNLSAPVKKAVSLQNGDIYFFPDNGDIWVGNDNDGQLNKDSNLTKVIHLKDYTGQVLLNPKKRPSLCFN